MNFDDDENNQKKIYRELHANGMYVCGCAVN